MLKFFEQVVLKVRPAGIREGRGVAFADAHEDPADFAAHLDVVPPAQNRDVVDHAERSPVLE